ncbi:hypothetical protein WG70_29265 [Burkholderia oklahomensis EO147]|nr:hypothetical protein WG70_29265 [Burkholderia oklahomensis EO147]AOI47133.1 hypothetical protein WI23_15850 [Burkholderia oklahomensis C6786]KUY49209.1 hypothetical protein WG70_19315 [Burkholderia oklahomensis EO147]KUY60016.1 hypothetical protein WI23_15605 [Burkholderia oklahomensis C6786]
MAVEVTPFKLAQIVECLPHEARQRVVHLIIWSSNVKKHDSWMSGLFPQGTLETSSEPKPECACCIAPVTMLRFY